MAKDNNPALSYNIYVKGVKGVKGKKATKFIIIDVVIQTNADSCNYICTNPRLLT